MVMPEPAPMVVPIPPGDALQEAFSGKEQNSEITFFLRLFKGQIISEGNCGVLNFPKKQ